MGVIQNGAIVLSAALFLAYLLRVIGTHFFFCNINTKYCNLHIGLSILLLNGKNTSPFWRTMTPI
jgi:hypothetical protein